jgi:hypothetical protein
MGQGMAEGWLRADTIRRSMNMPKMPVLDIAINVEARRGEVRGPATCHLLRADTWQGANMLALHQHYRDKDAKYWKGEREEKGG